LRSSPSSLVSMGADTEFSHYSKEWHAVRDDESAGIPKDESFSDVRFEVREFVSPCEWTGPAGKFRFPERAA